jgi:hypothetical protein
VSLFISKGREFLKMTDSAKKERFDGDELAARINSKLDRMAEVVEECPEKGTKRVRPRINLGDRDLARIRVAAGLANENCRQALFRTYLVLRYKNKKSRAEELILRLLLEKKMHKFLEN